MKRPAALALMLSCFVVLGGCWNYRGLDTLDIVAGMSVDRDSESGEYLLLFEIVDTQGGASEGQIEAKYVQSNGPTLFDAIRNAKKRLINRLYGGNMQTIVVSRRIAEEEGVLGVVEEILRDGETRETLSVVVSAQETAAEVLLTKGIDSNIISYEIHDTIREDRKMTASTKDVPLYQVYNDIRGRGSALVLPAVRCVENNGDTVTEVDGIALFDGDRAIGFQNGADTMQYLFVTDGVQGGVLSFSVGEGAGSVSFEIKKSSTRADVLWDGERVGVNLGIQLSLNMTESAPGLDLSRRAQRETLEEMAQQVLAERVTAYFEDVQRRGVDIFGLGRRIYQHDPALWNVLEPDWGMLFARASCTVEVQARIATAGVLKKY